ncbi:MAG: hypothetical protein LRS46_00875 [Desulfurococcales archaeon]|nr:hypothetical protein [Desulfurococcales archaeon]
MGGSPEEGSLEGFRLALKMYGRIAGIPLDEESALKVEELELKIMSTLRGEASKAVDSGLGLSEWSSSLLESGVLGDLYKLAAETLGVEGAGLEEARSLLESGRYDEPGAQALFIVLQAVARAYAEALLAREGLREKLTHVCPVCGVETDIMVARGAGRYSMLCPFCYYEWMLPGRGLVCPRCGSRDRFALGVYTGRSDRRLALLHCQNCGFTARLINDPEIYRRAPRSLLPLIALGADRYRSVVEED